MKLNLDLIVLICPTFVSSMLMLLEFFLLMKSARYKKRNGLLQSYFKMRAVELRYSRINLAK